MTTVGAASGGKMVGAEHENSAPPIDDEQHKLVEEEEEEDNDEDENDNNQQPNGSDQALNRPSPTDRRHPTAQSPQKDSASGRDGRQSRAVGTADGANSSSSLSSTSAVVERGPKAAKFLSFLEQFTLSTMFRIFGRFVGTYPIAFLISSLILASLSVGMYKLELRDRVRDGYTPTTSMSRYETDVLREFLGSTGDPLLTTVMLRARDRHSMHRLRWLDECVRMHDFLRRNISATVGGQSIRYSDICGPYCEANMAINYLRDALASQLDRVKAGGRPSPSLNLSYPIARVSGFELHLERNFYGVRTRKSAENERGAEKDSPEVAELDPLTDIRHIEAVMMTFRADISHARDEAKMAQWEMRVYEFSRQLNNSLIEALVLGSEIVDREMAKEAERTVPYFVMGFFFMFGFAVYTLLCGAFIYGVMDWAKPLLALGICLCPVLSVTSTFGVCTIAGHRTNSLMLIMPFLICGIGVNDAFLMAHSWNRLAHQKLAAPKRIGLVFEEVGPSITITTLTNVVTFAIGALTPTPEISVFCMATAVALGFAYIYTLMLFAPLICFANIVEDTKQRKSGDNGGGALASAQWQAKARTKLSTAFSRLSDLYCDLLTNRCFGCVLLVGVLFYWYFALTGTLSINAKLDTEKILPRNSPLLEPHRLISHMVWTEYYPLTVLVNNPVDIRRSGPLARLNAMLDEFEGLRQCKGKQFTILWLREYAEYFELARQYDFDYFASDNSTEDTDTVEAAPRSETGLDYSRMEQFLSSPFHKHFLPFLEFSPNIKRPITGLEQETPVAKFSLLVTFHNTTDWQSRIELMKEWRLVAQRYADLNVTVWEANGMFVDQMLSLKTLTLQTTFLTLACMALVCAIFIQNPLSVITASCAIGSISIGVIGFLSWWHLHLDPVTLCAVLMSIGMSVDFTAHTAYSFQLSHRRETRDGRVVLVPLRTPRDKLQHALRSIAWPMSQAGLSTVICVLPLVFLQNYIPLVFVKTISLVAIWGLFHGLVLMPAFLASLPPRWLEVNCYRMAVQRIQQMSDHQQQPNCGGGGGDDPNNDWDCVVISGGGCSKMLLSSVADNSHQQQKIGENGNDEAKRRGQSRLEPFRLSHLLRNTERHTKAEA
ncbi:hypothetical protein niasHT_033120 [Heterodera trifolii]|uniref:SSD domain-containing protein n=1 Tax=Heterodera trifolii TaxID=157864 RepID=A0ABD2I1A1_9BILA